MPQQSGLLHGDYLRWLVEVWRHHLATAVRDLRKAALHPFITHWHGEWTSADRAVAQVQDGDTAGQVRLEAMTRLLSVYLWRKIIADSQGRLAIVGDALGALHDALKLKARDSGLNAIMCEMALLLAPTGQSVQGAHIWSERNSVCDDLCRMKCSAAPPQSLTTTPRTKQREMEYLFLGK